MRVTRYWSPLVFAIAAIAMLPGFAQAQTGSTTRPDHWVMLGGGSFLDDINGDGMSPMLLGRIGTSLGTGVGRFFLAEITAGYARTSTKEVDLATFAVAHSSTPLAHADVSVGMQVPWIVTPYATLGTGVFHRAGAAGAPAESGSAATAAAGLRIRLAHRLLVGSEVRYRGENYRGWDQPARDFEFTGGIGWRF